MGHLNIIINGAHQLKISLVLFGPRPPVFGSDPGAVLSAASQVKRTTHRGQPGNATRQRAHLGILAMLVLAISVSLVLSSSTVCVCVCVCVCACLCMYVCMYLCAQVGVSAFVCV